MYWNGDEVYQMFRRGFAFRVQAAALNLVAKMKEKTGIQGPPRSLAGNPPHMDSTDLNETIGFDMQMEETSIEARVGSPVPQAGWMELGTKAHGNHPGIAPRPWCLSTALEEKEVTRAIIVDGADTTVSIG